MPYAIRYYRSHAWAERFRAAGYDKPAGTVTSQYRSSDRKSIQEGVDAINAEGPVHPAVVAQVWG